MSVLDKICADKRDHVRARKESTPLSSLKDSIAAAGAPRGFKDRILSLKGRNEPALIAEIKKASPSVGIIRADFNPKTLAATYESAGATCLSVLTDTPYFQGCDEDFVAARAASALPMIRKDFMVDLYQIYESRALGADCVLLIMAALDDRSVRAFYDCARDLGMDVLAEVHDEEELNRALSLPDALIGVNSRNLKTLKVDLQTAYDLARHIPASHIRVAESGIGTHNDLKTLQKNGYDAFLVGESLMRQADLKRAVRTLLGRTLDNSAELN